MKRALLTAVCLAAAFVPAEDRPTAPPGSDFVRFREDAKGAQLQTAIVSYRNAEGVRVDLIGAIHIADKAYYQALNKRFTSYEALLYEMVGEALEPVDDPPADRTPSTKSKPQQATPPGTDEPRRHVAPKAPPPDEAPAEEAAHGRLSWLHPLYDTLKNSLKLESQLNGIDYSKKNFVHADMTARQFAAMQEQRGEGFLQMWWRAVQVQIAQPESAPNSPGLLKILEILCRPDSPTELKRLVGRMFDQVERIMSGMETERGSVIVVERNKVALGVLQQEIAHGRRHLGIFYGAAHLTDMEQRLLAIGFRREKAEWLTAWDLPPEPPPVQSTATPAKPGAAPPK